MRILAVEDEPEYLEMLQDVMRSLGHTVTIASNGRDALDLLAAQPVDVIIADVRMPVMDGIEFHQHVRATAGHESTPFVFLTGVNDLTTVKAVCRADSDMVLKKPFPVDSLLRLFAGQMK